MDCGKIFALSHFLPPGLLTWHWPVQKKPSEHLLAKVRHAGSDDRRKEIDTADIQEPSGLDPILAPREPEWTG